MKRVAALVAVALLAAAFTPVASTAVADAQITAAVSSGSTASTLDAASATTSITPLVVLIDASGSMAESVPKSDGTGSVVKLEAAKQSLQEPIRNQPPGAMVGIWAFPGGSSVGGCQAGSWLVNVHTSNSTESILGSIDSLQSGGDTPTGPALQAMVDDLKAHGIDNANILVVSDGLYGCGPDPCEVAKELAGTGFKLTIHTVGFDISDTGRDSLTCMANATGGSYFDAEDGDELNRVIAKLTTPQFKVELSGSERPVAGKPTSIRVKVTNISVFDAHDVKLQLAFGSTEPGVLHPQVIPGTIGLGTLPAGQSATRTWRFVAGEPGVHAKAEYSVSAFSIETLPIQISGSFTTVVPGSEAADAGEILSGLIDKHQSLAILGDSFSSGEGTFEYLPASTGVSQKCHRSPDTYLARTFTEAGTRVEILACSGAVSSNLLSTQIDGSDGSSLAGAQLTQLGALDSAPGAVVMTIGGNDIGFGPIVEKCVKPGSSCAEPTSFVDEALARPDQLRGSLLGAYKNTWITLNQPMLLAARDGEYAPVIVLAYPELVRSQPLAACPLGVLGPTGGFGTEEVKFANRLVTNLNAAIESSVNAARDEGFEVYFVADTATAFLPDHSVCAPNGQGWVNAVLLTGTSGKPESMHPSSAGYIAETEAILGWSAAIERKAPTAAAKATATGESALVNFLNFGVSPSDPVSLDSTGATTTVVHPGQSMMVAASGLGAYPVTVSMHSDLDVLATLQPNDDGTVTGYVALPVDAELGSHDIIVQGWSDSGELVTFVSHLDVTPSTPLWVVVVGAAGLLLVLVALVLTLLWRRRLRSRLLL